MRTWHSPEELVEIGLSRSRVLMVNEAHNGFKRCIRTRDIGVRMIEPAHAAGVRYLAMEALTPEFTATVNRDRRLGPGSGYLAQYDLRELMNAALAHGWDLIAYDTSIAADDYRHVSAMNDREEQQARNLAAALDRLPGTGKLMVWCGWSHHYKGSARRPDGTLEFMGSRFQRAAQIIPFCIDQCVGMLWKSRAARFWYARRHRRVLERFGGSAGYLVRTNLGAVAGRPVDAIIRSLHNELQ